MAGAFSLRSFRLLVMILLSLAACTPHTAAPPPRLVEQTATLPVERPNTPDPLQAAPPTAPEEELLSGEIDLTATTFTLPITMTKAQLAIELYTTPEMLDAFTQGLPDSVPQGYIVVVPRRYVAADGETLTIIAQDLGVPVDFLSAVNPELPLDTSLLSDTPVRLPRVYTARNKSTLAEAAAELNTTVEALLTYNPGIESDATIQAGQRLVIPMTP